MRIIPSGYFAGVQTGSVPTAAQRGIKIAPATKPGISHPAGTSTPCRAPDRLADPLLAGIARVHCEHTDDPPQRHHTPLSLECATGPPEPSPHARGHMSTASPARCQGRGPIRRPPAPFSPAESEPTPSSAGGSQAVLARATSLKFWSRELPQPEPRPHAPDHTPTCAVGDEGRSGHCPSPSLAEVARC